jgi:putative spermidine/putrescine transport system permease protein
MFELAFLVAGPDSQTLIVALYSAIFTPGIRAAQAVDVRAVPVTRSSDAYHNGFREKWSASEGATPCGP